METVRIIKKITDDRLEELNRFKGKNVEIIIKSGISEDKNQKNNINMLVELKGSCPNLPDGMEFQKRVRQEWER